MDRLLHDVEDVGVSSEEEIRTRDFMDCHKVQVTLSYIL
jgi:hypothetical protein